MGKTFRTAGWLAVVALLGAALVAPAAVFAGDGPEVEPILHEGNIQGCPEGYLEFGFGDSSGSVTHGDVTVDLTYDGEAKTVDFVVTGGVAMIAFIKGGSAYNEYNYTGLDGVTEDDGLVAPDNPSGPAGLSHAFICVTETEDEETPTPSDEETPTPSDEETPTPEGSVEELTGTPEEEVTPPSTDTLTATGSTPSNTSWQLVLVAMAALLATALILTPAQRRSRK